MKKYLYVNLKVICNFRLSLRKRIKHLNLDKTKINERNICRSIFINIAILNDQLKIELLKLAL